MPVTKQDVEKLHDNWLNTRRLQQHNLDKLIAVGRKKNEVEYALRKPNTKEQAQKLEKMLALLSRQFRERDKRNSELAREAARRRQIWQAAHRVYLKERRDRGEPRGGGRIDFVERSRRVGLMG